MAERPIFLLVAGPNGAGKSTSYAKAYPEENGQTFRIINPDLFTKRLIDEGMAQSAVANGEALDRIAQWLETSLLAGHTIGVETVLSSPKYRKFVGLAQRLRYQVVMVYTLLASPEQHVERVRLRVQAGGHDVPVAKIKARYWRSLEQLQWFGQEVDRLTIYDNSGASPRMVGSKEEGGRLLLRADAPSNLIKALRPT